MSITAAQRSAIQTWLQAAWTKIQARQAAIYAERCRYRQFKRSHTIPPQGGAATTPDNLDDQPTDAPDAETIGQAAGNGWPAQVTCNVYESPAGHGYEAVARVRGTGGEVWRICRQVGPETWREHGWQQESES